MRAKILRGDVRNVLRDLPEASFDAVLTDPPYGLSFMGKTWDHGVPGAEVWAEVLRVLKPGAPLLAFGGTRTFHRLACAIEDAGFILTDTLCWLHGQGFPKGKSQLKPAWEPITLAWKKGPRVLAIDAARIPGVPPSVPQPSFNTTGKIYGMKTGVGRNGEMSQSLGRWPANVILDEISGELLDRQSGITKSSTDPNRFKGVQKFNGTKYAGDAYTLKMKSGEAVIYPDSGGASRFFYCAKASRKERNAGLEGMPKGAPPASARSNPAPGRRSALGQPRENTHPTVKPLKLCEYLAKLILPPERGTPRRLLVPFAGSGSECIGARKAGWDEITGIELSAEYAAIGRKRLKAEAA